MAECGQCGSHLGPIRLHQHRLHDDEVAAGGALAAVVVPLVAGALDEGDRRRADDAARAMLTWAVTILLPLTVLLAALAQPIAHAMIGAGGSGCSGQDARGLAATMIVIFAPQVLLYGIGITLSGVLQAHRRFLAAALAPLLSTVAPRPRSSSRADERTASSARAAAVVSRPAREAAGLSRRAAARAPARP